MHVVFFFFMYLYIPAREGDVCLRVVAIMVLTNQAMLRKARFWFRSVPSATLWKEKQKTGPESQASLLTTEQMSHGF